MNAMPARSAGTSRRQRVVDAALAGALLAVAEVGALTRTERAVRPEWPAAVLSAAALIPLAWRRRAPLAVWASSGAVTLAAMAVRGSPGLVALGPLIALYTVASTSPRSVSLAAVVTTLVGVSVGVAVGRPDRLGWAAFVFPVAVIAACWLIGDNLRVRRAYVAELEAKAARAEAERASEMARAAAEERARIARELHDVVVHHVSVIAVQAGAARMLSEQGDGKPQEGDGSQAWASVESTARQALGELRQLLGVLRREGEAPSLSPQPGLDQLDRLLEDVRQAGLPVEARVEGERTPLPPAVDLSAYRIVQEALTNVLKHQGPVPTAVVVRFAPGDLEIEVTGAGGSAPGRPPPEGPGQGLVGMRERVALFGGRLDAGPRAGGGFVVSAHIPLSGAPA